MNKQRYLIAAIAAAVFVFLYGWIVHGVVLADYWAESLVEGAMRPQGEEIMWAIALGCLLQGLALAFIFVRGYEDRGIMEGFRFGLLVTWFIAALSVLWYGLTPMEPAQLVVGIVFDGIMYIGAGVILAALYRR